MWDYCNNLIQTQLKRSGEKSRSESFKNHRCVCVGKEPDTATVHDQSYGTPPSKLIRLCRFVYAFFPLPNGITVGVRGDFLPLHP